MEKIYINFVSLNESIEVNKISFEGNHIFIYGIFGDISKSILDNIDDMFDMEIIFHNKGTIFKISLFECNTLKLYGNMINFAFHHELSQPLIHKYTFHWIEARMNYLTPMRYWHSLSNEYKYHWLRFNYFFQLNCPKKSKDVCYIDGKYFNDKLSFLCEIGEQLFGIGGYAGSDWDGCFDVLNHGLDDIAKITNPLTIKWINFNFSKKVMSKNDINNIFSILDSTVDLIITE